MRTLTISPSGGPLAIAATLLAAFVLLFVSVPPAAAHDALLESSPAADATVDTLPAELTLTFSSALIAGEGSTEIVVTDADGESVTDGPAQLEGNLVTQPLASEAAAGDYQVLWKVVSSDGHPTSGEFGFTVATSTVAPEPSADPSADATAAPAPPQTQTPVPLESFPDMEAEASFSPGWLIAGAVILLIVVFGSILLLRRRRPFTPDPDNSAER